MKENVEIDAVILKETIITLELKINENFPEASLKKKCHAMLDLLDETNKKIIEVEKPKILIRVLQVSIISLAIFLIFLIFDITNFKTINPNEITLLNNVIAISDAFFNIIVVLLAGLYYLLNLELKKNRKIIIPTINKLRSFLHVIDMHQQTKNLINVDSSKEKISNQKLREYLEHSSKMISLVSKIAALYIQKFQDEDIITKVNEIENLSTGLTQKIWQKIIVLKNDKN